MRQAGCAWICLMAGMITSGFAKGRMDNGTGADSAVVFSADQFYQTVVKYHPIVRQAALLPQEAQQLVRQARGAFDPKLFSTYDRKDFAETLYYQKWQSGLAIPLVPGGIDVKLGYDRATGDYLNPENKVPQSGLALVSVKVPIGMGLLIDERRSTLQQARIAVDLAEADRLKLVNKTLFDAAKSYWSWYLAYRQYRLYEEGYQLAATRFDAIRDRALMGEAAIIDTTEALISVQDRMVLLQQAQVEENNARLVLGTFLWKDTPDGQLVPVSIPDSTMPQPIAGQPLDDSLLPMLLGEVPDRHPDFLKIRAKGQQLEVEERYQRSLLQPRIFLNFGLLSRAPNSVTPYDWGNSYSFQADNHKIGAELTFPLLLRKERGKVAQVQIKRKQLDLERQVLGVRINNDLNAAGNQLASLEGQIRLNQQSVANQQLLLNAELEKFALGESSLFLVNSRETKLIDMQIKLASLQAKYQQTIAMLWYLAGSSVPVE